MRRWGSTTLKVSDAPRPVDCHVDRAQTASDHFPLRAHQAFAERGPDPR